MPAVDDARREQVRAGAFPVRLKAEDRASGPHNRLLDVVAPDPEAAARVVANFKQVVKGGRLKLHPMVARLVDPESLKKMGAERVGGGAGQPVF